MITPDTYSELRHQPVPLTPRNINLEFCLSASSQQDLLVMSHHLGLRPLVQLPQPDDDDVGEVGGGNCAGEVDCVSSPASHLSHQADIVGA